jgi:hypothetical protein
MQKATEEGSVLLAILEVEKSALEWKRELMRAWLSLLASRMSRLRAGAG